MPQITCTLTVTKTHSGWVWSSELRLPLTNAQYIIWILNTVLPYFSDKTPPSNRRHPQINAALMRSENELVAEVLFTMLKIIFVKVSSFIQQMKSGHRVQYCCLEA